MLFPSTAPFSLPCHLYHSENWVQILLLIVWAVLSRLKLNHSINRVSCIPHGLPTSSLPLGALLVENTRPALLATNRSALLQGNPHRAIAAGVVHDGTATLELASARTGTAAEALLGARGDLILLARHGVYGFSILGRCDALRLVATGQSD